MSRSQTTVEIAEPSPVYATPMSNTRILKLKLRPQTTVEVAEPPPVDATPFTLSNTKRLKKPGSKTTVEIAEPPPVYSQSLSFLKKPLLARKQLTPEERAAKDLRDNEETLRREKAREEADAEYEADLAAYKKRRAAGGPPESDWEFSDIESISDSESIKSMSDTEEQKRIKRFNKEKEMRKNLGKLYVGPFDVGQKSDIQLMFETPKKQKSLLFGLIQERNREEAENKKGDLSIYDRF